MKTDIKLCARCGGDHDQLEFTELKQSQNEWTHWASCPTNGEPIMMAVVDEDEPAEPLFNKEAEGFLKQWRARFGFVVLVTEDDEVPRSLMYITKAVTSDMLRKIHDMVGEKLSGVLKYEYEQMQLKSDPIEGGCPRGAGGPFKGLYNSDKAFWREDNTCSYCGCLNPDLVFELLKGGARWERTSKGYKGYLNPTPEQLQASHPALPNCVKVYTQHFDQEGINRLNALLSDKNM